MALSFVSLTLMQQIKSIRRMYFYNNDEKTDMILIYGVWKDISKYFEHLLKWVQVAETHLSLATAFFQYF
jgi:hypothetical protein